MPAIVAGNPEAQPSSERDRVVRRLMFVQFDLRRRLAQCDDPFRVALYADLSGKIGAAINIVASTDWELEP